MGEDKNERLHASLDWSPGSDMVVSVKWLFRHCIDHQIHQIRQIAPLMGGASSAKIFLERRNSSQPLHTVYRSSHEDIKVEQEMLCLSPPTRAALGHFYTMGIPGFRRSLGGKSGLQPLETRRFRLSDGLEPCLYDI